MEHPIFRNEPGKTHLFLSRGEREYDLRRGNEIACNFNSCLVAVSTKPGKPICSEDGAEHGLPVCARFEISRVFWNYRQARPHACFWQNLLLITKSWIFNGWWEYSNFYDNWNIYIYRNIYIYIYIYIYIELLLVINLPLIYTIWCNLYIANRDRPKCLDICEQTVSFYGFVRNFKFYRLRVKISKTYLYINIFIYFLYLLYLYINIFIYFLYLLYLYINIFIHFLYLNVFIYKYFWIALSKICLSILFIIIYYLFLLLFVIYEPHDVCEKNILFELKTVRFYLRYKYEQSKSTRVYFHNCIRNFYHLLRTTNQIWISCRRFLPSSCKKWHVYY